MNEEIKEILDRIKNYPEKLYCLNETEKSILLDYITNLQQENEFLKLNNPEMNIEHFRIVKENKRKIDNLRKENEILNQNNQSYQEEMTRTWKIANDYKSRIDKAIELINKNSNYPTYYLTGNIVKELENILNGSDENDNIISNSNSTIYNN